MSARYSQYLSVVLGAVLLSGALFGWGVTVAQAVEPAAPSMDEAMKAMSKAMGSSGGVEPVDFRKLKPLLPESLTGMRRTRSEGQKSAAFGISASVAEAEFKNDADGIVKVSITDMGSLSGMAAMAVAWANTEIDSESETGYEKTTTINGRKAHELYEKEGKHGEFTVLVANRFIVETIGDGVKMDAIKGAAGKVDLSKLEAMKMAGVKH